VIYAWVLQSGGVLAALKRPHVAPVPGGADLATTGSHFGFYWSAFIGLALALIFSIVGSMVGCACRRAA